MGIYFFSNINPRFVYEWVKGGLDW